MAKVKPSFPRRGCVYLVNLDPTVGHEIKKTRPVVIVSNNHMNELAATVLIMPITAGAFSYYHWITVQPPEGGLAKPSSIVTEQIRAVDKRRLGKKIGKFSAKIMQRLEAIISDHFALPESDIER